MVQLLRFAEGGRERYLQYSAKAYPFLTRVGAQVLYGGECNDPLLAPEGNWDAVVLVRYPSRGAYLEMVGDPEYQEIAPLRRSALREAARGTRARPTRAARVERPAFAKASCPRKTRRGDPCGWPARPAECAGTSPPINRAPWRESRTRATRRRAGSCGPRTGSSPARAR